MASTNQTADADLETSPYFMYDLDKAFIHGPGAVPVPCQGLDMVFIGRWDLGALAGSWGLGTLVEHWDMGALGGSWGLGRP